MANREALVVQLQTPIDENGKRKDMFPRTVAQAIEYYDKKGNQTTLETFLQRNLEGIIAGGGGGGGSDMSFEDIPYVSEEEPDHDCLWAKVKYIETETP